MKKSERFRQRQHDVAAFAAALQRLLEVCDAEPSLAGYPTWHAKEGYENAAAQRAAEVDRLAGRAAIGLGHEFFIEWKPRGTWQTQPVNPASGWRTIFDWDPNFDAGTIFAVCNQAIGALDAWASEAEEDEQSVGGKIRALRGDRPARPRRDHHVVGWVLGVTGAVIAGLVVAYLAHHFHWV
jgi:hypothetical protein